MFDLPRIQHRLPRSCYRQGIATCLMHDLLALAKRLAMRITVLETEADNQNAIALYHRCGFRTAGSYVQFIAPEAQTG